MKKKISLIGCGNMGSAMIRGIVRAGITDPSLIMLSDASLVSAERLASELGGHGTADNTLAVRDADIIILAVKPQVLDQVVAPLASAIPDHALVISVAAGISLAHLENLLGSHHKIVRVMPNLPAMVGAGMSAYSPNPQVNSDELEVTKTLLQSFGEADIVDESLMDAVAAVSGSGPAYLCLFIEALADAAVREGMSRKMAYAFTEQMVLGTAAYLRQTKTHPAELKDLVSSPAGTTIAAVEALEAHGMRSAVMAAVHACAQRSRELG
ncbi:pyrroline-5-carboxylate reductase [Collinsella sp. AGMB00827]|uniref:Pyrroline-5-carboxylate reductase n=1 Tax=Collinsella ureilytica TaxID=2869515 RepID=A0ABS7MIS3_9ACTN|nr:pyrroline-5-carboxylate reductase [Collinsella urealyticum]MBY4796928.1 pyrroline-5-carboxylate reductase [Collinsella urealyticum]